MIGDLPGEAVDADPGGEPSCFSHLPPRIVPAKEDIPPVDERHLPCGRIAPADEVAHDPHDLFEIAASTVAGIGFRVGPVDREGDLVEPRVDDPSDFLFGQQQPVGAGIEIYGGELPLEVLDHLHRLGMDEGIPVIEKIEPDEIGADLIDQGR